jgi:hypothetical protein
VTSCAVTIVPAFDGVRPVRHHACSGLVLECAFSLDDLPEGVIADAPLGTVRVREGEVPEQLAGGAMLNDGAVQITPNAVLCRIRNVGRLLVLGGEEIIVAPLPGAEVIMQRVVLGSGLGAILLQKGLFPLHASAVRRGAETLAFAADSGGGKSTMALAMTRPGYERVADDVSVITWSSEGAPLLHASAPLSKLWPDSARALGAAPAADLESGEKLIMPYDRGPGPAMPRPLTALYFLETAGDDEPVAIVPLDRTAAAARIGAHIYRGSWAPAMGRLPAMLRQVALLGSQIPCFELRRPHRYDRLPELCDLVARHRTAADRR